MSRIKEIAPGEMTAEQTMVFEELTAGRGRILTPYKVWIHSPKVAAGMEHIGTFLNKRSSLSTREVEICIILIARHWHGDYVLDAHIRGAREAGVPEAAIEAICSDVDPKLTDPHERAVYAFAASLVTGVKPTDKEFGEIEAVLGRAGIAEVLVLLGYYTSVALAMKVHEVPIPKR
jgi:4-carboxymuconolactone decarboxylase